MSRWQVIRRRIAPVAFLFALFVLATRTCADESSEVTLSFEPGAAGDTVREFEVEVVRGVDGVATFRRVFPRGAPGSFGFAVQLDPGDYELRFDVTMETDQVRFSRAVRITGANLVTLDLASDLRAHAPSGRAGAD